MKTFKYKTLGGLLRQISGRYFTLGEFMSKRFYHKTHGWSKFEFSDANVERAVSEMFAGVVWSRGAKDKAWRIRTYQGRRWGIFDRLWITKSGRAEYCAGQDYESEIRTLQTLLR